MHKWTRIALRCKRKSSQLDKNLTVATFTALVTLQISHVTPSW